MRVRFIPSPADIQMHDIELTKLMGGEDKFDAFLSSYLPKLVSMLQTEMEGRNDILGGDWGCTFQHEASYKDYPFAIILQMKKIRKIGNLAELAIEQIGFYSIEEGRKIAQGFTRQTGLDDIVVL